MSIKVDDKLLQKCIKNIDIKEAGKNSKIILKFNDDTTQEEIDAIKEFFENMYKDFAKMLGISEEELDNLCKAMEYLDELDEEECEEMVSKILNETLQNSNMYAKIAKKFTEEGIMNPTEYHQSLGIKTQNPPTEVKHYWYPITVTKILDRQEYIGDTINFRYTTRSFKDKTKIKLPKEQWKIFKNTHEAIIDEET